MLIFSKEESEKWYFHSLAFYAKRLSAKPNMYAEVRSNLNGVEVVESLVGIPIEKGKPILINFYTDIDVKVVDAKMCAAEHTSKGLKLTVDVEMKYERI